MIENIVKIGMILTLSLPFKGGLAAILAAKKPVKSTNFRGL